MGCGGQNYETLAICRTAALARAAIAVAIAEKPPGRFMIRSRTRVAKRHPEGDW
jgi:phenylpyruvate tautomerase PptA (4-oxalocrotonate tautomerase family)